MIAVDTNVLVRLLTRDDEAQFQQATALFAKNEIFIPETVILETAWVLRHAYNFDQPAICEALSKTLGLPNIKAPRPEIIALALELTRQGLDFADASILPPARTVIALPPLTPPSSTRPRG